MTFLNGYEVREGDAVVVSPTYGPSMRGVIVGFHQVPWTDEVFEVAVLVNGEQTPRWFAASLVQPASNSWAF